MTTRSEGIEVASSPALVTVGIPTYQRAELLTRALASVQAQSYRRLQVLVSDNGSFGPETGRVVASYAPVIAGLEYIRHEETMPVLDHFRFLLDRAVGKYFMWLADDDEISPNYVDELVAVLEANASAASGCGHWVLMADEHSGKLVRSSSYPQSSAVARALKFVWRSDDAFFYGLHRTAILREASFDGYWWPNRNVSLNWAYPYLFDVLLRGRIIQASDPSVQFINHDYSVKAYPRRTGMSRLVAFVIRRVNVHYMYWAKSFRMLNPLILPAVVMTSFGSLIREAISFVGKGSGSQLASDGERVRR